MNTTLLSPVCDSARSVIETELAAIEGLFAHIDDHFAIACDLFLKCTGRVLIFGMGKSGHIGRKIAATLASTGTPAFFIHPAEASHGDMGMVTSNDIVLAMSNSGETPEINELLPIIKHRAIPLISITGHKNSTLARNATVNLAIGTPREACPHGLAPTSSTTAMLVLGDAIAIALLEARGFTAENFALFHPGGSLGKRLILKIEDVMRRGEKIPRVYRDASLQEALIEMTQKGVGMTCVLNADNTLAGIYTDGDLRRTLNKQADIHSMTIESEMTSSCKTVAKDFLAVDALQLMEQLRITTLLVLNPDNTVLGIAHLHDLLNTGL